MDLFYYPCPKDLKKGITCRGFDDISGFEVFLGQKRQMLHSDRHIPDIA